ncbi:hypothetical protein Tco_0421018 [Tanacetum coccineum]
MCCNEKGWHYDGDCERTLHVQEIQHRVKCTDQLRDFDEIAEVCTSWKQIPTEDLAAMLLWVKGPKGRCCAHDVDGGQNPTKLAHIVLSECLSGIKAMFSTK